MYSNLLKFKEFKDSLQISSYRIYDSNSYSSNSFIYVSNSSNIKRVSRSRSFSLLRDYVKSNNFDYFVTITLKDDIRYDIPKAVKLFQDSISYYSKLVTRYNNRIELNPRLTRESESLESVKMMRHFSTDSCESECRSNSREVAITRHRSSLLPLGSNCEALRDLGFKFIYVFELTKNGGVHLHGFFSGFYDLYINQYGYISSLFFDKLGFQNFIEADRVNEFYLMKYITKDEIPGVKKRFFRSRNLKKPIVTDFANNSNHFYDFLNYSYNNEFCNMLTIKI